MKTPQNTRKNQNVHREPWHKHRDGDATDWWLQQSNGQAFCIWLTVSVSVLQDVIEIKRLNKGITRASLEMEL